jgi:hypothetical protein
MCSFCAPALFSGCVDPALHPAAIAGPGALCHRSVEDAAVAGLVAAVLKSRRVEYGGAIFQREAGCFVHSSPVTTNEPNRLEYVVGSSHGNVVLAGIYHTHTPGRYAATFSEGDRDTQARLGIPSYLGTMDAAGVELTVRCLSAARTARRSTVPVAQTRVVVRLARDDRSR